MYSTVLQNLKAALKARHGSLTAAAEAHGLGRRTLTRFLGGHRSIHLVKLCSIMESDQIDARELFSPLNSLDNIPSLYEAIFSMVAGSALPIKGRPTLLDPKLIEPITKMPSKHLDIHPRHHELELLRLSKPDLFTVTLPEFERELYEKLIKRSEITDETVRLLAGHFDLAAAAIMPQPKVAAMYLEAGLRLPANDTAPIRFALIFRCAHLLGLSDPHSALFHLERHFPRVFLSCDSGLIGKFHLALGYQYHKVGSEDLSRSALDECVRVAPQSVWAEIATFNLARKEAAAGKYDRAISLISAIQNIASKYPVMRAKTLAVLGFCLRQRSAPDALVAYMEALEASPNNMKAEDLLEIWDEMRTLNLLSEESLLTAFQKIRPSLIRADITANKDLQGVLRRVAADLAGSPPLQDAVRRISSLQQNRV